MNTAKTDFAHLKREALYALYAFVAFILLWLGLGFGLSSVEQNLLGLPLWVWGSSIGVLIASMLVAMALAKLSFSDTDF